MVSLRAAVRADFLGIAARLGLIGARRPSVGLHSYPRQTSDGRTHMHLRVQHDGSGLLFIDVSDVLHLSESATYLTWMALEAIEPERAVAWALARWHGVTRAPLAAAYARMRRNIDALGTPGTHCRTCAIDFEPLPLFSAPTSAPHKADIALTYACNNACPHCYNDPAQHRLSSLDAQRWRAVLDRLAHIGVPHVVFTGGEPTLHPALPQLIRHARDLGLITGLNTNGRRLAEPEVADTLAEAGLDHVQVTLHSHLPNVHNAMAATPCWQQTVTGIRAALQSVPHVITNTTLTRTNSESIEQTVSFLHALGLKTFALNALIASGGGRHNPDALAPERLAPLLASVRDCADEFSMRLLWYAVTSYCELSPLELELGAKRCNAGQYSICVDPLGDVLPCQSYNVRAGNLLDDSWEAIWNSELFRSFRDREQDPYRANLPSRCATCPDLSICGSGCRLERENRQDGEPNHCGTCANGSVRSSGAPITKPLRITEDVNAKKRNTIAP